MNRMKAYVSFFAVLIAAGCSHNSGYNAKILDFGIYTSGIVESVTNAPHTATGRATQHRASSLKEETTRIPAQLGTVFGFTYVLSGKPDEKPLPLRYVWTTPGITPPGMNTIFQEEFDWGCKPGSKGGHLIRFEEDWELVPGVWTLKVLHGNNVLAQQSFTVYRPEEKDIEQDL